MTLRILILFRDFRKFAEDRMIEGQGPIDTQLFFSSFPKDMPQGHQGMFDLFIQLIALLIEQFFPEDETPERDKAA